MHLLNEIEPSIGPSIGTQPHTADNRSACRDWMHMMLFSCSTSKLVNTADHLNNHYGMFVNVMRYVCITCTQICTIKQIDTYLQIKMTRRRIMHWLEWMDECLSSKELVVHLDVVPISIHGHGYPNIIESAGGSARIMDGCDDGVQRSLWRLEVCGQRIWILKKRVESSRVHLHHHHHKEW